MSHENLGLGVSVGPPSTRLPDSHPDLVVMAELGARDGVVDGSDVGALRAAAAAHPDSSLAWALLARLELDALEALDAPAAADDVAHAVAAYAYARVGYHRGLDALRRAGWRGQGPVPVDHLANRGFLAALLALGDAARAIGEVEESARITEFVHGSDPTAPAVLAQGVPVGDLPAATEQE
ncbi:DUF3151 family protein [Litorihabitans aurantiacus]|uniref:DUF3151 domain-containing protein n=1 Tax=Litorihabitans aurantiacus TaxID=1930061 RepID=A0AA37UNE8_9MICO|nr:DUF3151 family protein [Litorihabitans aurantiacus]GMA30131.1 hypothetical protein GCM10025875_01230 [Litorihabitans aurantiacus]